MMLLAVMMAQMGRAEIVTTTYDFEASVRENNTTMTESGQTVKIGSTTCSYLSVFGNISNPGRFARQSSDLYLRKSSGVNTIYGLYNSGSGGRLFVISNLYSRDVVTINASTTLTVSNGNADVDNNVFTIMAKGDLAVSVPRNEWIYSITIQHEEKEAWGYDPAVETYDLSNATQTLQSNNLSDESTGFKLDYDDYDAKYLTNLSSGLALNDRIAISQVEYNGIMTPWKLANGIQSLYNWHNISITNLVEGDRVVITWIGSAKFSSKAEQMAYNGCTAFKDIENNGDFDEGQDANISLGMSLEAKSSKLVDNATIYTSYPYVITSDGHLDIALSTDSKIVKVDIYGDHQAEMVDENNNNGTNTSYFNTTGQLEAKHHIVPGGLHVYIGNDDNTQHAEVVSSDEGPVSFVYDQDHYKMARHGSVDVMGNLPTTGTFYKFVPEVTGKMWVKFKAVNIKYRYYNNGIPGNGADNDGLPNEYTAAADVKCPYYLMVAPGDNNAAFSMVEDSHNYSNGATGFFGTSKGDPTQIGDNYGITVERGKTYYLYGWWQEGTNQGSLTDYACGVAELLKVSFLPNQSVTPLAKWVDSGTTSDDDLATVKGYTTCYVKKKSANIASCTAKIENNKLKISNIEFVNSNKGGGTILIKIGDPDIDADPVFAYTIAYNAGYNEQTLGQDGNGNDVKRSDGHTWNFSDNPLNGLKWNNKNAEADVTPFGTHFNNFASAEKDNDGIPTNGTNNSSLLSEEITNGDWSFNYRVKKNGQFMDPRFLNNWDMKGNNADMMWDTEGIIINAGSSQSCIFNEHGVSIDHSNNTQADPDRYVGFLEGGEFIIPCLKADDRVIIYMGSGSGSGDQTMKFHITNARDAMHNAIDPARDYHVGGSQWNVPNGHNDPYYRGCYHFYAAADGDMKFTMAGGSMCKLYSIRIYRGERENTNAIQEASGGYTILATKAQDGTVTTGTNSWNLHYRGKGETLADGTGEYSQKNEVIAHSGNIQNLEITRTNNSTISYTNQGEIGMLRVRAKCMDYNHNYVTDFADRNMTLALHETKSYPYTWDFTDMHLNDAANGYFTGQNIIDENANYNELVQGETGYEYEPKGRELSMWDANGYMVLYGPSWGYTNQNMIFENSKGISGNQLWANGDVLPETKGLWFYMDNNDAAYNGCMKIDTEGLHLMNNKSKGKGWWNYKMVVPAVPAGAAVYLRMARDPNVPDPDDNNSDTYTDDNDKQTNQIVRNYFLQNKFQFDGMETKATIGTEQTDICKYYQASDGTGDYIVAIKNTNEESKDLTFTLNGWILKKLAISTDPKTVNNFGWNTESRDHAIDPSLMSYMTGKDFRAYVVTAADKEANTVTLARIDGGSSDDGDNTQDKLYVPAAENGSVNACIVRYVDTDKAEDHQTVNIFNDDSGFHLFVPDMHDASAAAATSLTGNLLKARVTATTNSDKVPRDETIDGTTYNNYAFTSRHKNVVMGGQWMDGPQAFYRIVSTGAGSDGNQAYLSIKASGTSTSRSAEPSNSSVDDHYDIVFKDWKDLEAERGDVNGDGMVTRPDIDVLTGYVTARYSNGLFKRMGDMNDDGSVDIVDMTLLIQKIMSE